MNEYKVNITKENTHIENSYLIKTRKIIGEEVDEIIFIREAKRYPIRSRNSYINEWKGHNRLYRLHLFRKHTKDVDLEEPQSIFCRIVWLILGGL